MVIGDRRDGSIRFTASMASIIALPEIFAYAAAASDYLGTGTTLTVEVSPSGVRANAIPPRRIDSVITRKALESDPAQNEKVLSRTPMGRMGNPEEIGWATVYLSSPAAKFVAEETLRIDGGESVGF